MTPADRARQIDQDEFRRESKRALARALDYSKQKRCEERARIMGIELPPTTPKHVRNVLTKLGRPAKVYEFGGVSMTASAWAVQLGVGLAAFKRRIKLYGIETAVSMGGLRPRGWRLADHTSVISPRQDRSLNPLEAACDHSKEDSANAGDEANGGDRRCQVMILPWQPAVNKYRDGSEHRENVTDLANRMTEHDASRDQVSDVICDNASPAALATRPGVVADFVPIEGTGAGRHLQETTEITFSEKAISA